MVHSSGVVHFICVHLHANSNDAKIEMIRTLHRFYLKCRADRLFIIGDFNFIVEHKDRTLIHSCTSCGIPGIVAEAWGECFDNFIESYQQSHTRFPGNIGQESTSSRLDRIYCNLPVEAFALLLSSPALLCGIRRSTAHRFQTGLWIINPPPSLRVYE